MMEAGSSDVVQWKAKQAANGAMFDVDRVEAAVKPEIPEIGVLWSEVSPSTNIEMRELAKWGARTWTVKVAGSQSAGRGRYQRSWSSPPGGLYVSLLLKLPDSDSPVTLIPLLAGLALKEAIESEVVRHGGGAFRGWLKWPNDLLSERGKLAGILCEASKEKGVWEIIIGAGVNVEPVTSRELDLDRQQPATSLKDDIPSVPWTRENLLIAFLLQVQHWLDVWVTDPAHLREAWLNASGMAGRTVDVTSQGVTIHGKVLGIGDNGALRVETVGGVRELNAAEALEVRDMWKY